MRINCLSCGFTIDMDNAYGDYDGQIKCVICKAVLNIKTEEGELKSATVAEAGQLPSEKSILSRG